MKGVDCCQGRQYYIRTLNEEGYTMYNMSYCQVENTAGALGEVLSTMSEFDSFEEWMQSLNEYEIDSLSALAEYCAQFLEFAEELDEA